MNAPGMGLLQRRCFYAAAAAVLLSGTAWLALHYFAGGDEPGSASHAAEVWALRVHGAAASAVLVALGSVLGTHVPAAWGGRANAATGTALIAAALLLAATGWALYYVGDEALRSSLSMVHWVLGIVAAALVAGHRRKSGIVIGARASGPS